MRYRTALITGASSGLGRGIAERLAAEGSLVILCARRERELDELAHAIHRNGGKALAQPIDVADTDRTVALIRKLDEEVSGIDLVIANAAVGVRPSDPPMSWEAVSAACHINFCGAVATLTAVLPRMVDRSRGHLVGISSIASFGPLPASAGYCAPKAGLSMFLECLRIDLQGTGVSVTAVHPGFVKTPMTAHVRFRMPLLMECDAAVDRIVRALPRAPAAIDFPRPLAMAARASARLPRKLRQFALSGVGHPRPDVKPLRRG